MSAGPGRWADLRELAYPEVEALLDEGRPSVAIIPTGSTEAHGPHLPLCTDTLISEEVAGLAAKELAARGYANERLDQIVVDVLLGVR